MITRQDFELVRGDTFTLQFSLKDEDGSPLDLSTCSLAATFQNVFGTITKSSLVPAQMVVTNPTGGLVEIYFLPADTKTIRSGTYPYELKVYQGTNVFTVTQGCMELVP
jgi:hypothetical protein